jgi:tetratricopeptide (TPR) repeat protein
MTNIDSMFELAIELRDAGELKDSVGVLLKILENYPTGERLDHVYLILGGVYSDLGELKKALNNFKKATTLNPKLEIASLGLYITLAKLNKDEEAISELFRFLRQFPAKLYKDTLEELLEGLKKGYMIKYRADIIELSRLNGIWLSEN